MLSFFTAFNQPGNVKDVRGNYTLYKYDAAGNLLQTLVLKAGVGAALNPTTYTPIPADLVAWTLHTYDSFGNRVSTKQVRDFATQAGPVFTFSYNDTVNAVQGLHLVQMTRTGDKDGNLATLESDTVTMRYDALGRVTQGLTATWYATQRTYDALDRVVRGSDAVGQLRDYAYDANGNLIEERLTVSLAGTPTLTDQKSLSYDQADRLVSYMDAGGFVTTYQYDPMGQVLRVTNPDNYTVTFTYDAMGRLLTTTNAAGQRTVRTLDLEGKPRTVTDPTGATTTYTYYGPAQDGRLQRVTMPAATGTRTMQFVYDAQGNVTQVTDPAGHTTLSSYAELQRPTRIVETAYADTALGVIRPVTRSTYDPLGRMLQVDAGRTDSTGSTPTADAVQLQQRYTYDDFGRVLTTSDALNRTWRATYDVQGNTLTRTDAKGQRTTYTWDYGHQLRTRTDASGAVTTWTRNALGQATHVQSPRFCCEIHFIHWSAAAKCKNA